MQMQYYTPPQALAPTFYIHGGTATGGQANAKADAEQAQDANAQSSAQSKLQHIVSSSGFWKGVVGALVAGTLWKLGLLTPGNMLHRH